MPKPSLIEIPHRQQIGDAYCLPACVQMVLARLGIDRSQEDLGRLMGTDPEAGTPGSRLLLLRSSKIVVEYREAGWDLLAAALAERVPVIALVNTMVCKPLAATCAHG